MRTCRAATAKAMTTHSSKSSADSINRLQTRKLHRSTRNLETACGSYKFLKPSSRAIDAVLGWRYGNEYSLSRCRRRPSRVLQQDAAVFCERSLAYDVGHQCFPPRPSCGL